MKINYNNTPSTMKFYELDKGDVFLDEDGDAMMKTEVTCNPVNPAFTYNTVNLQSGFMYHTEDSVEVIPCSDACLSIN